MDSTSLSLLRRLRQSDEPDDWQRFVDLYAPLIFHWGRQQGLDGTDAADLVQEVMTILVTKLADFEYDPAHRFRGWLRTVAVNKARDFHRRKKTRPGTGHDETIDAIAVVNGVDLFEESEYRAFLANRALAIMKAEFPEHTWQACWRVVVEGEAVADVAVDLGVTENAIYVAKCRILRRLREELDGLLE